jgi:hypothetical protein
LFAYFLNKKGNKAAQNYWTYLGCFFTCFSLSARKIEMEENRRLGGNNMNKILIFIIVFSMPSLVAADHHKNNESVKRKNPNHLMNVKECMEVKEGIGFFLGAADKIWKEIEKYAKKRDKSWNDKKWTEAIALADLAANYSTVYNTWCTDMVNHE